MTHAPAHLRSLEMLKSRADDVAERAKQMADSLRAEFARTLLAEVFPDHSVAIFSRHWEENEPQLLQVLSASDVVDDFEMSEDPGLKTLPAEHRDYVSWAQAEIQAIGSDDDILRHLSFGETDHEGWTEFQLVLHPDAGSKQ